MIFVRLLNSRLKADETSYDISRSTVVHVYSIIIIVIIVVMVSILAVYRPLVPTENLFLRVKLFSSGAIGKSFLLLLEFSNIMIFFFFYVICSSVNSIVSF